MAATWAVEKNQQYLIVGRFDLITDHQPLVSLLNKPLKNAPLRIERMRVKLMGFDFVVKHRPGKNNPADWSSRHPGVMSSGEHQDVEDYVNMIIGSKKMKAMTLEDVKRETQDDEILQVMRSVKLQEPLGKEAEVQAYASVMSELSVIDGVLLRGEKIGGTEQTSGKCGRDCT